jgi:hypothetical protein
MAAGGRRFYTFDLFTHLVAPDESMPSGGRSPY